MADAEIIPIGTRGRPGRGTGTRPSSAARGLAPKAGAARKPAKADATPTPEKPASPAATPDAPAATPQAPAARKAAPAKKPAAAKPAATKPEPVIRMAEAAPVIETASLLDGLGDSASAVPAARTEERGLSPLAGIPVGDWLAAFQHAARELFGDQWEPQLARFLAFLRRRLTGDYTVDEYGFDPEVTERFFMAALRPIAQKWFRVEVRGIENIPTEGGALVVSNHSGTIPVDGLMTMVSIHDQSGRYLRPLGADLVFRLPLVGSIARKGGATLACNEDAERMLRGGELVGVWPEGFKGIGKPFSERYKLQRFGRGGFVSAALRTGVPIIPLSVVGAEEIYPLVGNIPSLARLIGVPYIPITPFFPLLGPLGLIPLPSKWLLEFGEPIRTDEYDAGAAEDPMLVFNVTDQVRETIQQTLYSLLMQRESVFK
ncbi:MULTISPECIES: lysophospholipid acyltransferase family protein [unclassified Nocardioides]|uniref:lysophospholipid acyltransferase family protein n=1 Tax=unclassified Nocardioides TaxID=2615069 RepID=UPI000702D6BE|nr:MULTISPECIES: lysophospholipid acyltransferase family protein [unclassified Nocardioides]KRC52793.1 glycerol acyltransferase [Nocardioides sp. Root79]KRC72324.1 glycerol acyltransferase [Nocardioides sp. Root240]